MGGFEIATLLLGAMAPPATPSGRMIPPQYERLVTVMSPDLMRGTTVRRGSIHQSGPALAAAGGIFDMNAFSARSGGRDPTAPAGLRSRLGVWLFDAGAHRDLRSTLSLGMRL